MKFMKKSSLIMILGLISFFASMSFAYAAEAKIGSIEYSNLEDAFSVATNGDTILLLEDFDIDSTIGTTIESTKNITFDLNDKQFKGEIKNSGILIITNGTMLSPLSSYSITNLDGATLLVDDVVFTGATTASSLSNDGDATIKNSKFNNARIYNNENGKLELSNNENILTSPNTELFENHGVLTIISGMFSMETNISENKNYGKLVIYGGTFEFYGYTFVYNRDEGIVDINGGTFTGTTVGINDHTQSDYNPTINVYDGTFTVTDSAFNNYCDNSIINIFNGVINSDSDVYILNNTVMGSNQTINIFGGTINAPNSDGILNTGDSVVNIGIDDGEVHNDSPLIKINKGDLAELGAISFLNFYDGKIIFSKSNIKYLNNVPLGYYVKYDKNTDDSYTAYLVSYNGTTSDDNNAVPSKNDSKNTTVVNPNTGIENCGLILLLIVGISYLGYFLLKRKNLLKKL